MVLPAIADFLAESSNTLTVALVASHSDSLECVFLCLFLYTGLKLYLCMKSSIYNKYLVGFMCNVYCIGLNVGVARVESRKAYWSGNIHNNFSYVTGTNNIHEVLCLLIVHVNVTNMCHKNVKHIKRVAIRCVLSTSSSK